MRKSLFLFLFLFLSAVVLGQTIPPFSPVLAGFGVLGNTGVANTGPSIVTGNVGVSPGSALTGFPPGIVLGTLEQNSLIAQQAQNDLTTSYNNLSAQPSSADLSGQNLGGKTLKPGVYKFSGDGLINGILVLDGAGDPNAVFVFQVNGNFSTATGSVMLLLNGARAGNVFWQIGGNATLQSGSLTRGNFLVNNEIVLNTGSLLEGRALSKSRSVTLTTSVVLLPVTVGALLSTDLAVKKTVAPGTYTIGSTVTYTITARNIGPANATNVQVYDLLPPNLTFVSASATAGSYNKDTGIFAIGNLNAGSTTTLTIVATINGAGPIQNTATILGAQSDPDLSNNTSAVIINSAVSDLSVTKTVNQAPEYRVGDEVTYTIQVTNNGPAPALNVSVTEKLATQLTFISASATIGTYNQGNGIYDVGTLPAGTTATLTLKARINAAGNISNTATIISPIDPVPQNNVVTVPICVVPTAITSITGKAAICVGTTEIFSLTPLPGITYNWMPSANLIIEAGQGTAQIRVRAANVATSTGSLQVTARNECGSSQVFTFNLTIRPAPEKPGAITGNVTPCVGEITRYAVPPVAGTSYTWRFPAGWQIQTGQGTAAVEVKVGNQAGLVEVLASNGCAPDSPAQTIGLTPNQPPATPGPITDITSACTGLSYTIPAVTGATTYNWVVPDNWKIESGQGTTTITVTAPNPEATGLISVTASNGVCGSLAATLSVSAANNVALNLPTAFTPNGDNRNDAFVIRNLTKYPNNELVILNRWGSEVYRRKNYQNDWTAPGLTDGTYFYVLKATLCTTGTTTFQGYITIAR